MAQETDWLRSLLGISVLRGLCSVHLKYTKKWFCIDCRLEFCLDCDHGGHRQIRLYRNNSYDAFRLEDIRKHYDCSKIQTYSTNRREHVRLKSKPDAGKEPRPSTKKEAPHVTCRGCGKTPIYTGLRYTNNLFCSIECKLSVLDEMKPEDDQSGEVKLPRRGSAKRKGIPRRAPFS